MKEFMFTNNDIDALFENCFSMPPYSRIEFLTMTQTKSGYSPKTFLNLLLTRWKDYREQVFSEYLSMGFDEVNKLYGFEFCLKIWDDEPEDFEFYDYTNKDKESVLDYSCCENENALSNFTINVHTEVAWLNEDILFLIRDYIYKLAEKLTIQDKAVSAESNHDDQFTTLINENFSLKCLEQQIKRFINPQDKRMYIDFVINEFNKQEIEYWLNVVGIQTETNTKYNTAEFSQQVGSFGLYMNNPDDNAFEGTTVGVKFSLYLNDFVRKCELIYLRIRDNTATQSKTAADIKPIETSKINNMDNDLFDNLHIYSTSIHNIPIESTTIERIIYLGFELFQEEFADAKSYTLQNALLKCKESAINVILANLNEAIASNCGNDIDFSDVSDSETCDYSYTQIPGETSIRKKYTNIKHQPADFQLFRKIWLYRFIEEIKDVRNAICTIIEKPVIDNKQTLDMPNKNDFDIDTHAANFGHCISAATRWDLKEIKNSITPSTPLSVFETYFENHVEYFNNFKKALRLEFDNPINGKGFEIDMKNKFYPMIKLYYNWYDKHKAETEIFEPYNFYEWIYEWTKDTENELNKYFSSELPNTKSIDIFDKVNEYKVFSNDLNEKTDAVFKGNGDKAKKLDTYFKDIFPDYIQSTNNILTLLEDMEKSFKSSLPALTEEYNKLVLINAGLKKQIIESVEKLFAKILEIDNNRFFYEYFEAINYLETRLELENKQIASLFKTLEKRIKHMNINSNQIITQPETTVNIATKIERTYNFNIRLIKEVHDHCNNDIFICNETDFINYIGIANFSLLHIKTKSKVKLLIYLLSYSMGSVWYAETARSISLQKSDCSGANVSDEKWKREMKRIIPQ